MNSGSDFAREHGHDTINAEDLQRGDVIEDGSMTGLVVKAIMGQPTGVSVIDLYGTKHKFEYAEPICIRLPRQRSLHLLT